MDTLQSATPVRADGVMPAKVAAIDLTHFTNDFCLGLGADAFIRLVADMSLVSDRELLLSSVSAI